MNTVNIGDYLRGNTYKIEGILGQGGFGITYLADFPSLKRKVAIKEFFLSGYCVRDTQSSSIVPQSIPIETFEQYKAKFIEEAQTLAQFNHPGIVPVTDIFQENNTAYFVMKYIKGKSLSQLIDEQGRLPEHQALDYITQAAGALKVVHRRNILHRDIKPENIIINEEGRAVLIDFGTARTFADGKTITHTTMLTPGYAPMEQYSDRQRRGFYTDIYALGATFYACLSGRPPLPAIDRLANPSIDRLPGVSGSVFQTIQKSMDIEPTNRFQDIDSFLDSIHGREPAPTIPQAAAAGFSGRETALLDNRKNQTHRASGSGNRTLVMAIAGAAVVVFIVVLVLINSSGSQGMYESQNDFQAGTEMAGGLQGGKAEEPPPAIAEPRYGTVTGNRVNTRSSPELNNRNKLKLQLSKGGRVVILEERQMSGNGTDQRTKRETYFHPVDGEKFKIAKGIAVKYVSYHDENFSKVLLGMRDGSQEYGYILSSHLENLSDQKWYKVRHNGQEVWVYSDYIRED